MTHPFAKTTALLMLAAVGFSESAACVEITVLSPAAFRSSMNEIIPQFERQTGHKIKIEFGPAGAHARRVEAGQAVDLAILTDDQVDELQAKGQIATGSKVRLARVGMGVFIGKGAAKYDISSVQAFTNSLLAARSIGHLEPASGAPSGIFAAQMLAKPDVASEIKAKIKMFPTAIAMYQAAANGEIDIGLGQVTEIRVQSLVDFLGPLPEAIQNYTVFAAGIARSAKEPNAAKAVVDFLSSPPGRQTMKDKGLEPL